jgi:hypothetical protein
MPYALPRSRPQQELYNQQLQKAYASTRRVPPATAAAPRRGALDDLKDLAQLRDAGMLTDAEFSTAKAEILASGMR